MSMYLENNPGLFMPSQQLRYCHYNICTFPSLHQLVLLESGTYKKVCVMCKWNIFMYVLDMQCIGQENILSVSMNVCKIPCTMLWRK